MEYTELNLKKIRKPELIEILKNSGLNVNSKMKVEDLKNLILTNRLKIRISQEEFDYKCVNNKTDIDLMKLREKNQILLNKTKKSDIIDLNNPKNKNIKYIIILHYYEILPTNVKVFTFNFSKDFVGQSEIDKFWGIPIFSDYKIDSTLTKYESAIDGFSSIYGNDIPAHLGWCKWDDTPSNEFRQYFGLSLLIHGRAYLVR